MTIDNRPRLPALGNSRDTVTFFIADRGEEKNSGGYDSQDMCGGRR